MEQVDTFDDTAGDEDFAELETLINPKPVPDAAEPEDSFDELEALLSGAKAEAAEITRIKIARGKARGGFGISEEDAERIRRWEMEKEWIPVSNTAIFKRYVCSCGFHSTVFEGLMLEQRHRHDKHANRWTAQETSVATLPNNTAVRLKKIPMCQRCAGGKGFPISSEVIWEV